MVRLQPAGSRILLALGLTAVASAAQAGFFPTTLSGNTTGASDSIFVGAPDDNFLGIGGQIVTYDFGLQTVVNRPGLVDFNVYEVDFGAVEFTSMTVSISNDGVTFTPVDASAVALVRITGDSVHSSNSFGRSYDLGAFSTVRYIRIDGDGSGAAGGTNGFDLDAIGAHEVTAVPEPETYALLLAGLGVVGLVARRRRG